MNHNNEDYNKYPNGFPPAEPRTFEDIEVDDAHIEVDDAQVM